MEAHEIFVTKAVSTKDILGQPGSCFYLPSYQRQYAWATGQVQQLCDDIFDGITRLYENEKTFTFCGSVITVKDANASSVYPKVVHDQPTSVILLIDGQQRLTTMMMIAMVVHNEIDKRINLFKKDREKAVPLVDTWLLRHADTARNDLLNSLVDHRAEHEGIRPRYPKMIRAGFDEWSPVKTTRKYESPIAYLVDQYMVHFDAKSDTSYNPPQRPNTQFKGEGEFLARFAEIKTKVQIQIAGNTDEADEFMPLSKTLNCKTILEELNVTPAVDTKNEFAKISIEDHEFTELLRTMLIARYILTRVAITSIQCKDEEYAFEVFEALNTSGTPLTAFETFVPMVVRRMGEANFAVSQQREELGAITNYFDGFEAGAARERKTKELVANFASSETGEKLGSHISRQQYFFKQLLPDTPDPSIVAAVVHNFFNVKKFVEKFDKGESPAIPMISAVDQDFLDLAFSFFQALPHPIVIPPLSAFYSKAVDSPSESSTQDFVAAVKAALAFTVLWRSTRSSTGGIDSRYRDLMKNNDEFSYRGLARCFNNEVDVKEFRKELKRVLKDKGRVDKKETFVEKAQLVNFYEVSKPLTRLVLLAAHDQSVVATTGALSKGRPGLHPFMKAEKFNSDEMAAIEHIAPQTRTDGWSKEIYDSGYLHRLGNLTLTSQKLNSSFGARTWPEKRVLYEALSKQSQDDARLTFDTAFANGIEFAEQTEELMAKYQYTPILESLSKFPDWNKASCESRGRNLSELTWDYFWLFLN